MLWIERDMVPDALAFRENHKHMAVCSFRGCTFLQPWLCVHVCASLSVVNKHLVSAWGVLSPQGPCSSYDGYMRV